MSWTSRAARPQSSIRRGPALVVAALLALAAIAQGIAPASANEADDAARPVGQVSAGYTHTCAVLRDSTATCWGNKDAGQSTPPAGLFSQVSANGNLHSCGLHVDGTIECWGGNGDGQSGAPSGTFIQVSTGSYHTCAVGTDGKVACWGKNDDGRASPPDGTFRQVGAGDSHSCGLRSDGTIACWGSDGFGQASAPDGVFTAVTSGALHSCGLRADGTVQCWGSDDDGQSSVPDGTFQQISGGYNNTCAVTGDGSATCWGDDQYRESTPPAGTYVEVSSGYLHSCGLLSDGLVKCWGWDSEGQSTKLPKDAVFRRSSITAGDLHSCGIADDGDLSCWGRDDQGQSTPPDDAQFIAVSAGVGFTCGLTDDGTAACWGANDLGQATPPADVFKQVSTGAAHACGLRRDGTIACWGDGSSDRTSAPAGAFSQVSAGGNHSCALGADGSLTCWGDGSLGQTSPPGGQFRSVSSGRSHSCAIAADGSVSCWGDGALGQTAAPEGIFRQVSAGDTTTCAIRDDGAAVCWGDPANPQSTAPGGTFLQLSTGGSHTCGLLAEGTRACWGSDSDGQSSPPIPGAPVLALPVEDQTATEDDDFSFTFEEGTFVNSEGGKLAYAATLPGGQQLPNWLRLDAGARTFRGKPADADVGVLDVVLSATNEKKLAMTTTFTVTVENTEDAPRVDKQIKDQKLTEDTPYSFTVPANVFVDDDLDSGDVLTYTAGLDDGSTLPGWLTFDAATQTLSGTPSGADVGSYSILVTVTDTALQTTSDSFRVEVVNINDAPVVALPIVDQPALEDSPFRFTYPDGTFTDEDPGDQIKIEATLEDGSSLPGWLKFDAGSRTFSGTPTDAEVGRVGIALTATDRAGASATAIFGILVENTNDPPTLSTPIAAQSAIQGAPFTFVVPADTFADVDSDSGDTLALRASSRDGTALPAWLSFDPATGTFTGTPADRDVGSFAVTVTGTDQGGAEVSTSFAITVANTNDAPTTVDPIPNQLVTEGEAFALTVDPSAFADPDADAGDTLTFGATRGDGSALPAWLVFDPESRSFLGTPGSADVGTLSVSVIATDSAGATTSDTFDIQILQAHNDPTAPTVTLRQQIALTASNAVPLLLDWSAGAETTAGARASYRIEVRRIGASGPAAWKAFVTVKGRTGANKPLAQGTYQLRIRATVPGSPPGPFVEGAQFTLSVVQDDNAAITYSGNWSESPRKGASGGTVRRTVQNGASATFTAEAQSFGMVLSTGPSLGSVQLCLDPGAPGERCRDYDLAGQTAAEHRAIVVYSGLTPGPHTVRVTASGGEVLLDAIVVLK